MVYKAYQLLAKFNAGLTLIGQNEWRELEWIGTDQQWRRARDLELEHEINYC